MRRMDAMNLPLKSASTRTLSTAWLTSVIGASEHHYTTSTTALCVAVRLIGNH